MGVISDTLCYYYSLLFLHKCRPVDPHHAAQSAQLPRSAMEGKLLIANPNCTTAIAAMALWPSGAQCDDNGNGLTAESSIGQAWIFGFQHLKLETSWLPTELHLAAIQACCQHSLASCLLTSAAIRKHHILLLHGPHMDPIRADCNRYFDVLRCRCPPVPLREIPRGQHTN